MAGTEHERRRFITRHDVEDAAAAGRTIQLRGRDVLTDEAAQRAMDLGVSIERDARTSPFAPSGAAATSPEDMRRAVRAAVVAELGREPDGLDAAIRTVMERRNP